MSRRGGIGDPGRGRKAKTKKVKHATLLALHARRNATNEEQEEEDCIVDAQALSEEEFVEAAPRELEEPDGDVVPDGNDGEGYDSLPSASESAPGCTQRVAAKKRRSIKAAISSKLAQTASEGENTYFSASNYIKGLSPEVPERPLVEWERRELLDTAS